MFDRSRSTPVRIRLTLTLLLAVAFWLGAQACGGSGSPASPSPHPSTSCTPAPGVTCFGRQQYVEYAAGDLPIVVSVPHGGALTPATIPNRTGTTVTDSNTIELGRAIVQAVVARTGRAPHLIVCHLRRTKLDANREVGEAAQGNAEAIQAWTEYHDFVGTATRAVAAAYGRGVYIDLHGHGHDKQRLELGYLLSSSTLDLTDGQLDAGGYGNQSSLRLALGLTPGSFSQLLRGPASLGGLLGAAVPSVPSPAAPSPGDDPYFEGGYSTSRHTATIPGLQIETNFNGVRDSPSSRAQFAETLAAALASFLQTHLGLTL